MAETFSAPQWLPSDQQHLWLAVQNLVRDVRAIMAEDLCADRGVESFGRLESAVASMSRNERLLVRPEVGDTLRQKWLSQCSPQLLESSCRALRVWWSAEPHLQATLRDGRVQRLSELVPDRTSDIRRVVEQDRARSEDVKQVQEEIAVDLERLDGELSEAEAFLTEVEVRLETLRARLQTESERIDALRLEQARSEALLAAATRNTPAIWRVPASSWRSRLLRTLFGWMFRSAVVEWRSARDSRAAIASTLSESEQQSQQTESELTLLRRERVTRMSSRVRLRDERARIGAEQYAVSKELERLSNTLETAASELLAAQSQRMDAWASELQRLCVSDDVVELEVAGPTVGLPEGIVLAVARHDDLAAEVTETAGRAVRVVESGAADISTESGAAVPVMEVSQSASLDGDFVAASGALLIRCLCSEVVDEIRSLSSDVLDALDVDRRAAPGRAEQLAGLAASLSMEAVAVRERLPVADLEGAEMLSLAVKAIPPVLSAAARALCDRVQSADSPDALRTELAVIGPALQCAVDAASHAAVRELASRMSAAIDSEVAGFWDPVVGPLRQSGWALTSLEGHPIDLSTVVPDYEVPQPIHLFTETAFALRTVSDLQTDLINAVAEQVDQACLQLQSGLGRSAAEITGIRTVATERRIAAWREALAAQHQRAMSGIEDVEARRAAARDDLAARLHALMGSVDELEADLSRG